MKKLLIALALLMALWTIPYTRTRMAALAQPVLERLGPVGKKVAAPALRYRARSDAKEYLRLMRQDAIAGRQRPDARGFADWAETRRKERPPVDPWGGEYWLQQKGKLITIGSSGPDGERGTADDIAEAAEF